jgi:hypothetical protein
MVQRARILALVSSANRTPVIIVAAILSVLLFGIDGCYSFRGTSIPPHLKTISVSSVVDNSGFGSGAYRELCYLKLVEKIRQENSLLLVERDGDARLKAVIKEIRDEAVVVRSGEIERDRKVRVSVEVEYYDAVKRRAIFQRSFSNAVVFEVARATTERDVAIRTALQQNVDDILLAIVSGW